MIERIEEMAKESTIIGRMGKDEAGVKKEEDG